MAIYKCPKCGEIYIESKQMMVCPSCYYKGKLIEMKYVENDDEQKKPRFNAKETMKKAIEVLETEHTDIFDMPIKFSKDSMSKKQRKMLRVLKENNIVTWKELIDYEKNPGLRELRGFGTYFYATLAHLICSTFGIQEVTV